MYEFERVEFKGLIQGGRAWERGYNCTRYTPIFLQWWILLLFIILWPQLLRTLSPARNTCTLTSSRIAIQTQTVTNRIHFPLPISLTRRRVTVSDLLHRRLLHSNALFLYSWRKGRVNWSRHASGAELWTGERARLIEVTASADPSADQDCAVWDLVKNWWLMKTWHSVALLSAVNHEQAEEPVDLGVRPYLQTPPSKLDNQRHQLQKADHYREGKSF